MSEQSRARTATLGGLLALAIWSGSVAVTRGLANSLGTVGGSAVANTLGATIAITVAWRRGNSPRKMLAHNKKYLLGCGLLFVIYGLCYNTAIGWSPNDSTSLVTGLVNYLWPALTVALSVPILGRKARPTLWLGCILAVAGLAVAVLGQGIAQGRLQWQQLSDAGWGLFLPVGLAAAGGVIWALYSNLVRRRGPADAGAVPLFLGAAAVQMWVLHLFHPDLHAPAGGPGGWAWAAGQVAIIAILSQSVGYVAWEWGMRRGNQLLLSLASYLTPIASVLVACLYLSVPLSWTVGVGTALVAVGAIICKWSIIEPKQG